MKGIEVNRTQFMNFLPHKFDDAAQKTAICWMFFIILCAVYLIGTGDASAAGAAPDPSAPLEMLKTARTKAASSNLSVASATTGAGNIVNMILILMGVVGTGTAAYSGYTLWNNIQQGEQARGSNMTYTIGLVGGAMLTLIAVVVGAVTNFVVTA